MKRFLSFFVSVLLWPFWRAPAWAQLTTLGVGGIAAVIVGNFMTPSIVPQPATYFNWNAANGANAGLRPNMTGAGALQLPTVAQNSFFVYIEGTIDPALNYGGQPEFLLGATSEGQVEVFGNSGGVPSWALQRNIFGNTTGADWWDAVGPSGTPTAAGGTLANYATGYYPFTPTGGGCDREPTGVWKGGGAAVTADPGFNCRTATTPVTALSVPGTAAQQSTGTSASPPQAATTCAVIVNGAGVNQAQVTVNLAVGHGIAPGQTYPLSGFMPTGYNGTYTALASSTATTLVGTTGATTCPTAVTVEGKIFTGTGVVLTFPGPSTTSPYALGSSGITTRNNQHFCALVGEYGADSSFPGAQFVHMVDEHGNALDGAPAFNYQLNQGTANFTGYVQTGTQSPSTPALVVTAMNPYSISAASFNATTGYVTFTTTTNPGFTPGSEFTVASATNTGPGSFNLSYVAVAGTNGTTIVGNPLNGPLGILQASALTGSSSWTSGGSLVSVIMPNMAVLPSGLVISPFGTFGGTGAGGVGTYGLVGNPAAGSFSGSFSGTTLTLTAASTVVPGGTLTSTTGTGGTFVPTTVVAALTGTGGVGSTYQVANTEGTISAGTVATSGAVGSSGSPVTLSTGFNFYFTLASTTVANGGIVATARTAASIGDFWQYIGTSSATLGGSHDSWGGSLANFTWAYGAFPQTTGGIPDTAQLANLCKKSTDMPTFAATNNLTLNSRYEMNDVGTWADSSIADFQGYVDSASGSTATLHVTSSGSPLAGSATAIRICGPGVAGSPNACPTIKLGAGPTYTLTWATAIAANLGSSGSPVSLKAGKFQPSQPLQTNPFTAYIDNNNNGVAQPTLHVTMPTPAAWTGQLGSEFTGRVDDGTNTGVAGTILTVTAVPAFNEGYGAVGIGSTIQGTGLSGTLTVINEISGVGGVGTYQLSASGLAGSPTAEAMFASGVLPAPASAMMLTGVTGTVTGGFVTDGGVNIAPGNPIKFNSPLTAVNGNTVWAIYQNYYPGTITYTGMTQNGGLIAPGMYIQTTNTPNPTNGVGITTPVSIIGYGGGSTGGTGLSGNYLLSNGANIGNTGVGSSTGPVLVPMIATSLGDSGSILPGPALTIKDTGPGVTFPVTKSTISCTGIGACTGTGNVTISGTFDTNVLGGNPTTIQAAILQNAGGQPIAGCSACQWTNLDSYSATLSSGTVWNWKGRALNIPAGIGPFFVSARASNDSRISAGTFYATTPSLIKIGTIFDWTGEGQAGGAIGGQGGIAVATSYLGLWGQNIWSGANSGWEQGPGVYPTSWSPALTLAQPGDATGVAFNAATLQEPIGVYEQLLSKAFGWPTTFDNIIHDTIGLSIFTMDNVAQGQSVDLGDGTSLVFCSVAIQCANSSPSGALFFNAAEITGANIHATVSGLTLTIQSLDLGGLQPGMTISFPGITGTLTLGNCTSSSCTRVLSGGFYQYTMPQTWTLTGTSQTVGSSTAMRLEPASGPAQAPFAPTGGYIFANGTSNTGLVQPGSFQVSVGGVPVCKDTTTPGQSYSTQQGNCTDLGSGAVSSGVVNFQSGDYQITFVSGHAPASGVQVTASFVEIQSPDGVAGNLNRPAGIGFMGNGTLNSGGVSNIMLKTPGGSTVHVDAGGATDDGTFSVYQAGAPVYTSNVSWLYSTKFPALLPGQTADTPFASANPWRGEGAEYLTSGQADAYALEGQWSSDVATKSTFSGTVSGSLLTLTSAATGPMWEGEVVDCVTVGTSCAANLISGIYITSLASGAWGANGSTYNISNANSIAVTAQPLQNAVYYMGPGPAFFAGPFNDLVVQGGACLTGCGAPVAPGFSPHATFGMAGGRRVAARSAALMFGGLTTTANASDPTIDRVKADATGCDTAALAAPCFDIGNTYAASHSATIQGSTITVTGGLTAHQRPFVVGQALSCTGCTTGRFITSVSLPPSQDTTRQINGTSTPTGQIGNTFTITASGSLLTGPMTETVTAGCSGTSGTGSNCIDLAVTINTTNGTYGTAAALATCGENNLNGGSAAGLPPNGICHSNGIGSLVRGFRIGSQQSMWSFGATGSYYDDGVDAQGGAVNQSGAFTCNIVAAKVVQCVIGAGYNQTTHVLSGVGQWPSSTTYISYGDSILATGREFSLIGYVGGQPFPITTPGSGGTAGTTIATAAGGTAPCTAWLLPKMDITTNSSGQIVNAYMSTATTSIGLSLTANNLVCTFTAASGGGTVVLPSVNSNPIGPIDGVGGVATYNSDSNMMGDLLYDNSGLPGNPLNMFFTNSAGGYFEPGLPIVPFGLFMGIQVSG